MPYENKRYNKENYPKKPKRIGSLWKADDEQAKNGAVLTGYLDLGLDAGLKIVIRKNTKSTSAKSPGYVLEVMVRDFQQGGNQQAAKAQNAGGADDEVPF